MRFGLKFQLILMAVILVGVTVAISSYFFSQQERDVLLREMTRRGITIARNLATTSTDFIVSNDQLALATFVDSIMRNEGMTYALIVNETGQMIAHNRIENVGKNYLEPPGVRPISNEDLLVQPYKNAAGEKQLDIAVPIMLRNGVRIGVSHVGMSGKAIDQLVTQALREAGAVAAGLLLIGIIVSIGFTNLIVRPVLELVRGARALGEGNLDYHLDIRGPNELSLLGRAFNEMADRLKQLYVGMLRAMAKALESRDKFTGGHDQRSAELAAACAAHIGMSADETENIRLAAQVQNIGHIAVPDSILDNPGKLTGEEYERMKEHTIVGAEILSQVQALRGVVLLVRHHHERFDGTGYPQGLKGKDIPLGARIMSVADAFDAMVSRQKHRQPLSREQAIGELRRGAGTQFDPEIVDAFIAMLAARAGGA